MAGKADGKSGNSGVLRVKYRKGIKERASSTGLELLQGRLQ